MELIVLNEYVFDRVIAFLRLAHQLLLRRVDTHFRHMIESWLKRNLRRLLNWRFISHKRRYERVHDTWRPKPRNQTLLENEKNYINIIRLSHERPTYLVIDISDVENEKSKLWRVIKHRFYAAEELFITQEGSSRSTEEGSDMEFWHKIN